MTTGGDPDELARLAAGGPGQAFTLDHAVRLLDAAGGWHRRANPHSTVSVDRAAAGLRWLGQRISRLDHWVLLVAAALRTADATSVRSRLLELGAHHPAAEAVTARRALPVALPVGELSPGELDEIAGWARLPGPWRDRVHRERAHRWLLRLHRRTEAVPPDADDNLLDLLARWVDGRFVDRLSRIVDLHVDNTEAVAHLQAQAEGTRRLLAHPELTVWSFSPVTPSGGPAMRVAFGDPATATHLVVVLPGTGSGLHAPAGSLAQAQALHRRIEALAGDDARVATVLDLYDAPVDLGRAADPRPGRVAGAATAAFLTDLPADPVRTTVVGHSYGAFAAARVRGMPLDALVLLGAPGTGVATRAELTDAREVWAARAADEPIGAVADLDEFLAGLPPRLRPTGGPLADPLVALGPDPSDPEFGARPLPTDAGPADDRRSNRGHVDYLAPGTVALDNVARVALGLPTRP